MTDAEIIKAFRCCFTKDDTLCDECPNFCHETNRCIDLKNKDLYGLQNKVLDLINRLKAENERLEASIKEVNEYLSQGDFAKGIALVYRLVKEMGCDNA